jgi:hypothetical protein
MLSALSARSWHRLGAAVLTLLLTVFLTVLLVGAGAGSASAADGYKYWNYFHVTGGKYVFATTGPADHTPRDGSLEAYRYGLSSTATGLTPRAGATTYTIDEICVDQEAGADEKRVGVLIDYGTPGDAARGETPPRPRAACAVVPTDANGQQVLDAVADVRLDKQLLCGIDGYPVRTCSVTVKNPPAATRDQPVDFALPAKTSQATPEATSSDSDDGGVPWPLVGALAAVVVIGGAGFALSRRNKSA